ncbi:MAG: type II toxin-antitoxin system VapC family toxin [Gammaproteobacteria bacterium]
MVLVDSSVWIDYFNGRNTAETDKLHALLGTDLLATGDLILVEVLQGFRHERQYKTAKELLTSLTVFNLLGREAAIHCADNYRRLQRKGITIRKTADVIIATFCITHNLPILFSDKDFLPFVRHLGLRSVLTQR